MRNETSTVNEKKPRPYVVELVGPAGAGKTTLTRQLTEDHQAYQRIRPPQLQQRGDLPFFAWNGLRMLPTFYQLRRAKTGIGLSQHQRAIMVVLQGWNRVVAKQARDLSRTVLLDQGPISLLAYLYVFKKELVTSQAGRRWWEGMSRELANVLDLVVWLDAPNEVLIDRALTREKNHGIKSKTFEESCQFLEDYRSAFDRIFSIMAENGGGPKIERYNTQQHTPGQLAAAVEAMLAQKPHFETVIKETRDESTAISG